MPCPLPLRRDLPTSSFPRRLLHLPVSLLQLPTGLPLPTSRLRVRTPTGFFPNQLPTAATQFHGDLHNTSFGCPLSLHHHDQTHHDHFPPTPDHLPVQAAPQSNAVLTPRFGATASASKLQPDPAPLLELHDPATPSTEHAFHRPTSRMQTDRAPAALTDHAMLRDSEIDAFQRHANVLCLDRLPSSSTTNKNNAAVLAHSPLDSAPEVFGEMPTPQSGYENFSGHHTPIHSTYWPDGNNNLSEQNVDGMPQAYGLHNLDRQSIFLADGTECRYFTLPADYSLEQDVPAPVFNVCDVDTKGCTDEFVDMLASSREQQLDIDEKQESKQPPKCSSEQSKNPLREVVSEFTATDNVDVSVVRYINFKHGQCVSQVLESVLLKDYIWLILLSEERIEIWDPGALVMHSGDPGIRKTIMDIAPVVKWSSLLLVSSPLSMPWDPGATEFPVLFTTAAGVPKLQCTDAYKFAMVQTLAVKFSARRAPIFQSAIMCSDALGWTEVNASTLFVLVVPCSTNTHCSFPSFENMTKLQWDPGIALSWYTFILLVQSTVRETSYAYYLAIRNSNGTSIYYPENIMCYLRVNSVLEEKEIPCGPSTRFCRSKLQPMQCSAYYQTCNSLSFHQYSQQDIPFLEIALWSIHFHPP